MSAAESDISKSIEILIANIRGLHKTIEHLSNQLRGFVHKADKENVSSINKQSGTYWRLVAYLNSLIRIKLFLEQNFNYIEPMVVIAVTRYLFELTVWLRLMQENENYGCVYYLELINTQLKYYHDLQGHLTREVTFLKETGVHEKKLFEQRFKEAEKITDMETRQQALQQIPNDITQVIDNQASRRFSIYSEQAQSNGYAFQAYLIETKKLPNIEKSISDLELERNQFERDATENVRNLVRDPKGNKIKWNWKQKAIDVGMEDDYNFIYSYTSRLLHAFPVSVATNHKNLELDEIRIFLKYIHIRLLDIIEITQNLLLSSSSSD